MNKLLRRLFFTIAILIVAAPALAERGLFVVNNATCAGIPSPEANLTYCLPSSGVNQNQLMVWNGSAWVAAISGTGSAYATVRDEGTALAQRTTLNLTGAGVTCVDNSGASRTDCDIPGGGGGGGLASTDIDTSAELRTIVTDETGTGALVFGTSPTLTTPNIGSATGSISGNAGTATALAANGANCSSGNAPLGVDASGAVESCFDVATQAELNTHAALTGTSAHGAVATNTASQIVTRDSSGNFAAGTITAALTGNASTATALAANGANCSGNNFALGVDASGAGECAQPAFSNLSGSATDAQIPNNITVDLATTVTTNANLTGPVTSSGNATSIANDAITLGTHTTGNYVSSATASQGLLLTGTEGGSLGLIDCAANEILKRNAGDTAWECAADSTGGSPSFDTIASGTNTGAAMVVGTGASLAVSGSGTIAATTAAALAANGSNCSAGQFPLGVDAAGAVESCTALPTTIAGTSNQIAASASTGAITLSIPTSPTLPGTTTGTFSGNLTGAVTGNASTATALAANGANCSSGNAPLGVDASGAVESCFDVATQTELNAEFARTARGDAAYTILTTDRLIGVTAALTAPRTFTLPAASAYPTARVLSVVDEAGGVTSSNTLTIARAGSDTINGATSVVMKTANSAVSLESDGSSKWTMVSNALTAAQACGAGEFFSAFNADGTFTCTAASGGLASTDIDTSAELRTIVTDETGTGALVFANTPTLVTPILGTPTSGTLTNATGLPIATGVSGLGTGVATFLATPSSTNLASALTGETGSGAAVFGTAPTLDAPIVTSYVRLPRVTAFPGSPSAGDTVIVTDDSAAGACDSAAGSTTSLCQYSGSAWVKLGDGTGAGGALTSSDIDTSAELRAILTDETGTGAAVFANTPTLVTPVLGAATGTSLNLSGLTASRCIETDGSKNLTSAAAACGSGGSATGTWSSTAQRSTNNSGTPNTQFDLIADQVILRNPSDNTIDIVNSPSTVTCNVSTAGPAANGRDQAGAFSANSWIHFYWIRNGTTLACLASTVAPMTGPTFPSTYTHWSYATSVRFDGSSHLYKVEADGNMVRYLDDESNLLVLTAGNATSFTAVDMSAFVPPNSREVEVSAILQGLDSGIGVQHELQYRPTGSSAVIGIARAYTQVGTIPASAQQFAVLKTNSAQSIDYKFDAAFSSSGGAYIIVVGYKIPNNSN